MAVYSPVEPVLASLKLDGMALQGRAEAAQSATILDHPSSPLAQALDSLDDGLILTNAASTVVYANRAARAMLGSGSLAIRNGLLCAGTASDTHALQRVIAGRARDAQPAAFLRLPVPGARRPLMLTVTTADDHAVSRLPDSQMVLVLIRDGRRVAAPPAQMISTFFNLTPAEARLACEMIKGDGLKACATRLGITPNTARTHLNRVFDKTGTKRQAELVRLLLSCRCAVGGCPGVA